MSETTKNDINAVREALFATLRSLGDKDNPMEIDRAKAICETSQAIINTAKLEVDFVKVTGLRLNSGFIPVAELPPKLPVSGTTHPQPGLTVHKMK